MPMHNPGEPGPDVIGTNSSVRPTPALWHAGVTSDSGVMLSCVASRRRRLGKWDAQQIAEDRGGKCTAGASHDLR